MGSMTVLQIQTRVRRQFGDEAGILVTDAATFDWINDAMREVVLDNDLLRVRSTSITVIGQSNYGMPTDILRLHSLSYDGRPVEEISLNEARKTIDVDNAATFPRGVPQQYWQWGAEFFLYPAPQEAKTLTLYYNRTPVAVTATSQTPELPAVYDNRIIEYCLAQAAELDDNPNMHQLKMTQFQDGLEKAKDEENVGGLYPHMGVPLADSAGYTYMDY